MSLPPGPFRTQDAAAYGMTPKMLRGRRFGHPVRGVVTVGADLTLRQRVMAARLVVPPDAVVIGLTGLQLRGIGLDDRCGSRAATRIPSAGRGSPSAG